MATSLHKLVLNKFGVDEGDRVSLELLDGSVLDGIIMPKHEFSGEHILILKLDSGYNIGIDIRKIKNIKLIEKLPEIRAQPIVKYVRREELPKVVVLGVGGTILSRVDYRTGAVRSAISADELLDILPELIDIAEIETKIIMNKYSEHLTVKDWEKIAKEAYSQIIRDDVEGVVILHGTDTLGYTAAALSFALRNLSKPVILVGSQRSSDRPSSDAALNLISAIYAAAYSPFAHVMVAMHKSPSDNIIALHIGTRIRKNHTSRRDAFQSIDIDPIGYVRDGKNLDIAWSKYRSRDSRLTNLMNNFNPKAALIKFYPSITPSIIEILVEDNYDAIIIEGTGLGHIAEYLFNTIKGAIKDGVKIFMTSQCIWGRTNLYVYDTGRELLSMGVIPLGNMLSETALVKAMWALGNFNKDDLIKIMLTNYEHEITRISPYKESGGFS